MLRAGLILAFGTAMLASAQASAPAPQQPSIPVPTLRANVSRVVVDVVVTDRDGRPVPNLTQADFLLAEDGVPQPSLSFDIHGFGSDLFLPPRVPSGPPNTFINLPTTPERGPLYLLLLDLNNSELNDQIFARRDLERFLAACPEGTRVALFVFSDGLHLMQGFTADKALLTAAADPQKGRKHLPRLYLMGQNTGGHDSYATASVFDTLARYLQGLPGRKNILWLSGAFPLPLFADPDTPPAAQAAARELLDRLAAADIAIYPVSARGLVAGLESSAPGATSASAGLQISNRGPSTEHPGKSGGANKIVVPPGAGFDLTLGSQATQDVIAEATGGKAFYSNNAIDKLLGAAVADGSNYYTLTYAPPAHADNGRPHAISVQLKERGYTLSYRRAYYGNQPWWAPAPPRPASPSAAAITARPAHDTLSANVEEGAPVAHGLVFAVHAHPVGARTWPARSKWVPCSGSRPSPGATRASATQPHPSLFCCKAMPWTTP